MVLDRNFCFSYTNDAYLEAVQQRGNALIGRYVFDVFPETAERIESVVKPWRRTLAGETTSLEALPFHVEMKDGTIKERVWKVTHDPVHDADGTIIGLMQRTQDITDRHELEQRNIAISHELSHRVKNIMAVVSAIARITGRNATDVPAFVKSFTERLNAMSRTNDLQALENWRGLDVETILRDELSPYEREETPVYKLSGPKVRLSVIATKDLSMVCHELATNAIKYGCLQKPDGFLDIVWSRDSDQLTIRWHETCAHKIQAEGKPGFGSRLFDMLPYATVERELTPKGLYLTITMDGTNLFA